MSEPCHVKQPEKAQAKRGRPARDNSVSGMCATCHTEPKRPKQRNCRRCANEAQKEYYWRRKREAQQLRAMAARLGGGT